MSADTTELVRYLYQVQPHLVICEAPGTVSAAWQVLVAVRELSDIPLLVLSEQGSAAERDKTLALGTSEYLSRPYEVDELIRQAQTLLGRVNTMFDDDGIPGPAGNLLGLRQPLACLTPAQIMQIDDLLLSTPAAGRIRLSKHDGRLCWVSAEQQAHGN